MKKFKLSLLAAILCGAAACTAPGTPAPHRNGIDNSAIASAGDSPERVMEYLLVDLSPGRTAPTRFLHLGFRTPGILLIEDEEGTVELELSSPEVDAFNNLVRRPEFEEVDDRQNPCSNPPRLLPDVTMFKLSFKWAGDDLVTDYRPDACLSAGNSIAWDLLDTLKGFWMDNLECPTRDHQNLKPDDPAAGRTACYRCLHGCDGPLGDADAGADTGPVEFSTGGTPTPAN